MPEFSIADAKSQFAQVVHQAEQGQPVHITRRGRPVAVLLSQAEYTRLAAPRSSVIDFTGAWRQEVAAAGVPLLNDQELAGLRDRSDRPPPDLR